MNTRRQKTNTFATGRRRKQSENGNIINDSTRILTHMLNSIQQRAFDKMFKLDVQTGQTKPTIAMGKRWKNYYNPNPKKKHKKKGKID